MKICSVGDEVFHADRQMTKLTVDFRNFAKAPKNAGPMLFISNILWSKRVTYFEKMLIRLEQPQPFIRDLTPTSSGNVV
jgi:hypothetical protein